MDTVNLIQATATPRVLFDPDRGVFVIKGRSTMEDARAFYSPLIEWITEYITLPRKISIVVDLEYFNTTTNKFLQTIFYILSKNRKNGISVIVYWLYDKDDEDIWESGQEFAHRSELEFVFLARVNYVLERVEIQETESSPKVDMDPLRGVIEIKGKSNLPDLKSFYMSLVEWLTVYIKEPRDTAVNINLDNINETTGRFLQIFFTMLSEIKHNGFRLMVNWCYNKDDHENWKMGKECAAIVGMEFNFIIN